MTNLLKHSKNKISLESGENTRDMIDIFWSFRDSGDIRRHVSKFENFFSNECRSSWDFEGIFKNLVFHIILPIFLLLIKFWTPNHQNFRFLPWLGRAITQLLLLFPSFSRSHKYFSKSWKMKSQQRRWEI